VLLPGLPLQLWNKRALEALGNELGRFIVMDEQALKSPDKRLCKELVEIDLHVGLLESIEIEWRGHLRSQRLDYLGVPFHCSLCRRMGHLHRDCQGGAEEDESDSSVLKNPTCEDPPEVDSWARRFSPTEAEVSKSLAPGESFSGKLKCLCPSLFFSLSS
jgi:hypothetical protein